MAVKLSGIQFTLNGTLLQKQKRSYRKWKKNWTW
jgi:hypothetical protein